MLEMNARSLQQKLETERELKQRLMEEVERKKHTPVFKHLTKNGLQFETEVCVQLVLIEFITYAAVLKSDRFLNHISSV